MNETKTPAAPAQAQDTQDDGFTDELIVIRRIRKELASADPTARERILSYVVQTEQAEQRKASHATLERLHAAANGMGKSADFAAGSSPQ
jgi:hypothetical protein